MSSVLLALMWLVLGLLALVLAVLAAPLRIELSLHKSVRWRYTVALRFFGGIGPRLVLAGETRKPAPAEPAPAPKEEKKPARKRKRRRRRRRAINVRRIVSETPALIGGLLRCIHVRSARLRARFGLGDPAETGQIYGLLCPAISNAAALPRTELAIEPVFDAACLTGEAALELSVRPLTLFGPAARFGWRVFGPWQ
ncbi:MAG: DUF2953 domain-containing protein [Alphaproteobacteria bacterium]|nr:DUF2953 domain-containing protein [Alphaproteobacteria bacterium]